LLDWIRKHREAWRSARRSQGTSPQNPTSSTPQT
jgi:hypothetical protein